MCVNVGRWPTASMARIVLTADLINTNQDRRVIGDRTRRISLVTRMPGSRQSPTLARASVPGGTADTANDGGANAVVTRRWPRGTARSRAGRDSDAKGRGPRCVRDQVTVKCPGRLTNDYLRAV
jgi:hypothetical protein